jgi:probable F420-dependent oxidoreductase
MLSASLQLVREQARSADRDGVGVGWIPETKSDPFSAAALALLDTSRLRVGTAVAVAFARSPFVVAQAGWELARASNGRFILGLGTQVKAHIERRFSATWDRPVARLAEYVRAIHALWNSFQTGEPPSFEGEFYRHTMVTPLFDPGPISHPAIPIMLAGVNRSTCELAGERTNGLIAHPLHSRRYLNEVVEPAIQTGVDRAQRVRAKFELVVPMWLVTGRTNAERDESREAVRQRIAIYGSTRTYRSVFELHGWHDIPSRLHRAVADGRIDEMGALISDEMVETFAVVCAPDDVGQAVVRRVGGIADRVLLYEPLPRAVRAMTQRLVAEIRLSRYP